MATKDEIKKMILEIYEEREVKPNQGLVKNTLNDRIVLSGGEKAVDFETALKELIDEGKITPTEDNPDYLNYTPE